MATETKTTTSQPSRARRAESPSVRAFRASMGEMLPARRAGPRAAARVTTIPTTIAATNAETGRLGSSMVTSPTVRTQATMTAARIEPMTTPTQRPDDAEQERLAQDEPGDLAAGRAGRPQQAEFAGPLDERHRERVEDEERAGEQGDRGDERGRGLEVGGRGPERGGEVGRRREDVRLDEQAALERGRDGGRIRAVVEGEVDPRHGVLVEDGLGRPQRHDDGPPERPDRRAVAFEDPDDPVGRGVARALDASARSRSRGRPPWRGGA